MARAEGLEPLGIGGQRLYIKADRDGKETLGLKMFYIMSRKSQLSKDPQVSGP